MPYRERSTRIERWDFCETAIGTTGGTTPGRRAESSNARRPHTGTGSRRTARPVPPARAGFAAESGRYHLYVSLACPWAHRTLIFREIKGLRDHVTVDVVHPFMGADGWTFDGDWPGATGDTLLSKRFLREVYVEADPQASGRVTVPVLWDRKMRTIVSNESSEIIRMFNSAFDGLTGNTADYWPERLREAIEPINTRIYDDVNNGVYKAGFATTQEAYDEAVGALFGSLDWLEKRLSVNRYLMGDVLTEADWRLVHDAVPVRSGLPRPLQMQSETPGRLPESVGLHARTLSAPHDRRNGGFRPHHASLLFQSRDDKSATDRPDRARDRLDGAASARPGVSRLIRPPWAFPPDPCVRRNAGRARPCLQAGGVRATFRGRWGSVRRQRRPRRTRWRSP